MDGARLKEVMQREGVSQRRVAARLGLRPETLSRRLSRPVPPDLALRILSAVEAERRAAAHRSRTRGAAVREQLEALLDRGDTRPLVRRARRPPRP